jgi:hypothetical protein
VLASIPKINALEERKAAVSRPGVEVDRPDEAAAAMSGRTYP